ncbi:Gp49 family protein [Pseudomonas juntendi]|uniref:Gp49 family protein n=1 Tax=Pseudomonas juntendi TaxID=2666183 RepID=UPI002448A399|nr:Gp49 family protein [Pseudomonas juntendi]MDH1551010.1 Gp49 family protein [Pseudomonas juntendi]
MIPTEQQVEQRIAILGLSAPRVTSAMIDALVESLTYDTHYIPGTTTVLATSFLPSGFSVATDKSAAASPENFNLQLGIELAIAKCKEISRQKLWELEGYRLKQALQEKRVDVATEAVRTIRAQLCKHRPDVVDGLDNLHQLAEQNLDADALARVEQQRVRLYDLFKALDQDEAIALSLVFWQIVGEPKAKASN